jgi:hypothetical protein
VGLLNLPAAPQQQDIASRYPKGSIADALGAYEMPDPKWPQWSHPYPDRGFFWGSQGGVFAESADRIYFAARGRLPLPQSVPAGFTGDLAFFRLSAVGAIVTGDNMKNVIVVGDRNGKMIEAWNQWDSLFVWGRGPHQIYINPYDPERHVWVVDDLQHCVFKFTHDGKQLVQTLGVQGEFSADNEDLQHLWRPTMMDFAPDGTFYVADGYRGARVIKYDRTGKPLMKWGTRGTGPGQFGLSIHGLGVGGFPLSVYVSDTGNKRIQVFDTNGKFLDEWPGFRAYNIFMSADNHVWLGDWLHNKIFKMDLSGRMEYVFTQEGFATGNISQMHQLSADPDGNLYIAEAGSGRTQKFRPRPGGEPSKILWPRALTPMTGSARSSN